METRRDQTARCDLILSLFYLKSENHFFSFKLYVEKNLEEIFKILFLEDFFSSKPEKMKMLHLEVFVKMKDLEVLIS